MEDLDLKKLGMKHIRNAEKLDHLIKYGFKSIEYDRAAKKFVLSMNFNYKNTVGTQVFVADTVCETVEEAYEVWANAHS